MTTKRLMLAMLSFCAVPAHAAERYTGDATARDGGGGVLYREVHIVDATRQVVSYQCPDGRPFARKLLTSHGDPTRPDVVYEDARSGFSETVRTTGRQVSIHVKRRDGSEQAKTIDMPAGAVIDAGFDPYIRGHWQGMDTGETVPFLVASRFRFYDIKITGGQVRDGQRRLSMKLDAWYAFAAPDIDVTYGTGDHRLLRYEGMGTIRNARGKSIDVRIDFPASGRVSGQPASMLDKAWNAPLDGTCVI